MYRIIGEKRKMWRKQGLTLFAIKQNNYILDIENVC